MRCPEEGAPATLVGLLRRAGQSADTGLRLLDRDLADHWLGWSEVASRANQAAAWLRAHGVRRGDHVALIFPTSAAFFDAFFGVLLAGAVPVPLYPPVRLGRLDEYQVRTARMLRAADVCLLLTDRRLHRIVGEVVLAARPRLGCHVLPAAHPEVATISPSERNGFEEVSPDELALVQFSSGTTRDPQPVALTHRAVVAQTVLLNSYWPDEDGVRHSGASWLPLYHDMGLIGCVFTALERPGTLTLIPPELFVVRPAVWLQTISRYRATISPAPNFAYSLAADRITDDDLDGVDLSCWRVALCGAETVVADVLRRFQARFAHCGFAPEALTPVYGLSEAALAVTFTDPARAFVSRRFDREALGTQGVAREDPQGREIVSVGRPVPGFDIRICDDEHRVVTDGCVGVVECRGPSLMRGYLAVGHQPDSEGPDAGATPGSQGVLGDGWLDTGDLGFTWHGDLYLAGRRKDVVIVRGTNYAPEELELAAGRVDGVRAGCTVAVSWLPEGADTERLLIFVEARRDVPRDAFAALAAGCRQAIVAACGLAADEVVVLAPGSLPRTSSGKLRRRDTLAQHLAGSLAPPSAVTPVRLAGAAARSAVAHVKARLERKLEVRKPDSPKVR
ncbi:MAG: fatty acyl-AMP ligase [Bacteroidales bacterium]